MKNWDILWGRQEIFARRILRENPSETCKIKNIWNKNGFTITFQLHISYHLSNRQSVNLVDSFDVSFSL